MIDLHSHILPCFDDGAKSVEEAFKLINMEIYSDVNTIAVTPHFFIRDNSVREFTGKRDRYLSDLNAYLSEQKTKIEIIAGAEVKLSLDILSQHDLKDLCYSNTKFLLVELPLDSYWSWIPNVLYELRLMDIVPVLAHIERYHYFIQRTELLYELISLGAITQINADSIINKNFKLQWFISRLIKHNLVHVVATDTHTVAHRPPRLKAAMQAVEKKYGHEIAQYFIKNSEDIASNIYPGLLEPLQVKKLIF